MSYDPPHPSYPSHPSRRPYPDAPSPQTRSARPDHPPHPTYPWQPAPPEPPRPPHRPAREPLGHHSDLRVLRSAYRWQRRTATLTALGYFTVFLVLSACAPGVMTSTVADGIPAGLLLALLQLPVTWLAIALYEYTAHRYVDPLADRIRRHAELDARRGAVR
ncbi:DUF485 domain-containing protein [Streptomyces actinomycinicus]|uniref:DUF485 domain-containing protein n=1 Tax=Streptomyces actinomycinicus TaxID=1695166 RepID=A0A937JP51_9ACTN|nr:DUF485 domain-containing protein [Streptomyces actinomycinicus]MBL1082108.1 DUF485 domain-containing protein [Streptomyces actinomycinicus]